MVVVVVEVVVAVVVVVVVVVVVSLLETGHASVLHSKLIVVLPPPHLAGSTSWMGVRQVLSLDWMPPPQVTLHGVGPVEEDQAIAIIGTGSFQCNVLVKSE